MIYFPISKALQDAVLAGNYAAVVGRMNSAVENPPSELWLQMFNLPASTDPVTVGEGGEDNYEGVLQIDISCPLNQGTGSITQKADEIAKDFAAGKVFTYNGTNVSIRGSSLSPGRVAGGFYKVSLSIRYYARHQRNL